MICKKCGSENIQIQKVSTLVNKRGWKYWLLGGWFINLLSYIIFTLPRVLIAIFIPKRKKVKTHSEAVCQSCGYSWEVK